MNPAIIEFRNVTKRFGQRTILDRVNVQIHEGDVTTIIGKSGEGKSVLLKHIIGLLKPEEGSVLFRGEPIEKMSRKKWNAYLSRVSYMFQNNALFDSKTVYENVALPLKKFKPVTPGSRFRSVTAGEAITRSPFFQSTGVATWCSSVNWRLSMTRRISSKLRPVDFG